MSEEQLEEIGPIDYVVLEWKGDQPGAGEVQPLLLDLVDRGIIRILDIAFLAKDEDGSVSGIELGYQGPRRRPLCLLGPSSPSGDAHWPGTRTRLVLQSLSSSCSVSQGC